MSQKIQYKYNHHLTAVLLFTSHEFFSSFLKKNPADIQTIKVQVHILETFVGVTFSLLVVIGSRQMVKNKGNVSLCCVAK